jgi:chromosome segregation ATPase
MDFVFGSVLLSYDEHVSSRLAYEGAISARSVSLFGCDYNPLGLITGGGDGGELAGVVVN